MKISLMDSIVNILAEGSLRLKGEFMWGSNYTYLLDVKHSSGDILGVYKPTRGVRPLWDFPSSSLARREVAAYLLSQALGWELVPPTVLREDGPYGQGSLQQYIEHDPEYHYYNFSEEDVQRLRPTVLFDLLLNNADRKASHILLDPGRHLWLIDHGLCFHKDQKLRSVIWDFAGEPLPAVLCQDLTRLQQKLGAPGASTELSQLLLVYLAPAELKALQQRLMDLLVAGKFINPDSNRRSYPWPPV